MIDRDILLSVLDNYMPTNSDDIAMEISADFRRRRVEKNLTPEQVAEKDRISVSNIVYFE